MSIQLEPGIHGIDIRPRLYFNKYLYRGSIELRYGNFLWGVSRKRPKTREWFLHYVKDAKERWPRRYDSHMTMDRYERYCDWFFAIPKDAKFCLRSEGKTTSIYSNDLNFINTIAVVTGDVIISKAVVGVSKTVKYFRTTPKHKYRVYLRSQRTSVEVVAQLKKWLNEHSDKFHASPALNRVMYGRHFYSTTWLSSSHYIDYDVESLELFLQMHWDEILGKQYRLELYTNQNNITEQA